VASKDAYPATDAALRAAGVADDVTAPATLLSHAGRVPDLDLAIVARLSRTPDAEGAAALRTIETAAQRLGETTAERLGWKAVAKEARRVLYRFGQRGVAVPPPAPAEEAPRLRTPSPVEGRLSAIDGRGDRLLWIIRTRHDGGLAVLTAILNEPGGLRDVALAEMARKQLRRMEQDLQTRHRLRMVAADAAYCDALLEEGFARARVAGTPGVGEYPAFRARLFSTEPAPRDPPLAARMLGDVASAIAEGPALLAEPEFHTWLLDRAVLGPYAAEISAARESPLVLSRPQQEERGRAIVTRALQELFGGEAGPPYRRRLEEMAYFLHATGRPALARAALASANALGASRTGGEGVPFFEELTRRSFGLLLQEDAVRARAESESSVLVRPGAPGQSSQPRRRPR